MPTKPAQYRLVIFEAIDQPQELRELFSRVMGVHPTDVVQWLARAPGTWPQPLEESPPCGSFWVWPLRGPGRRPRRGGSTSFQI